MAKKNTFLYVFLVLCLVAVGISTYLTRQHYELLAGDREEQSVCNINTYINCDRVTLDDSAELLGFAVSSIGIGFYILLFFLGGALLTNREQATKEKLFSSTLIVLTLFASLFALRLLYISLFKINSICLFCIGLDVVTFLLFGLAICMRRTGFIDSLLFPIRWIVNTLRGHGSFAILFGWTVIAIIVFALPLAWDNHKRQQSVVKQLAQADRYLAMLNEATVQTIPDKDRTSLGSKEAALTIVEFSDFGCPFCRKAAFSMKSVVGKYKDRVRVLFRNYPLDNDCNRDLQHAMHPFACRVAMGGICADQQNKFWQYHDAVFSLEQKFDRNTTTELATNLGLDVEAFKACMREDQVRKLLRDDLQLAKSIGVTATPTFFFNGKKVAGFIPPLVFEKLIEANLEKKK